MTALFFKTVSILYTYVENWIFHCRDLNGFAFRYTSPIQAMRQTRSRLTSKLFHKTRQELLISWNTSHFVDLKSKSAWRHKIKSIIRWIGNTDDFYRSSEIVIILILMFPLRYPVRYPFLKMLNRSLSTSMKSITGSDYTMYHFATHIKKDFYNLLSVNIILNLIWSPWFQNFIV